MIHTWHRVGCTYDIHVCTHFMVIHNKNMENHSVLSVLPEVYYFILACTAHVRCMYYAILHYFDFRYVTVLRSDRYITPKKGQGRWVAFL
jgi:hypothetical protein